MLIEIMMWYIRRLYKKQGDCILTIKGFGKSAPSYLLYTEDVEVCNRMEDF